MPWRANSLGAAQWGRAELRGAAAALCAWLVWGSLRGEGYLRDRGLTPLSFCSGCDISRLPLSPTSPHLPRQARLAARSLKTPWDETPVSFKELEDAKETLRHPELLSKWGVRAQDIVVMNREVFGGRLDLSESERIASDLGPLYLYLIGETGAGKSTLAIALAEGVAKNPIPVKTSATTAATMVDTEVPLPSGLTLVDTRGFRIPNPLSDEDKRKPIVERFMLMFMYSRQVARWESMRQRLRNLVRETQPSRRPASVLLYVHRAGTRIVVDRIVELLQVGVKQNVPTFLVLTDVNSVDDEEIGQIRAAMKHMVDRAGTSARGQQVQLVEVNSASKTVQQVEFKASGLAELIAKILNSIRPVDVLQFARWRPWYRAFLPAGRFKGGKGLPLPKVKKSTRSEG